MPANAADDNRPPGPLLRATLLPAQAGQSLTIVLLAPIVPQIAEYFGGGSDGAAAAQLAVVFPFCGIALGGLLSGFAISRCGVRRLILLAALMFGGGAVVGGIAPSLPVLIGGAMLLGLGAAFLTSGLSAVTALSLADAPRARMIGLQSVTANILNVLLGLGSATLAERFGWRVPFGVFAVFALIMLGLALLSIPRNFERSGSASVRFFPVLAAVWPLCLAAAAAFAICTVQSTELPFLLQQNGMTSVSLRAVVVSFATGFALLGSLLFGFARARLSERGWIAATGGAIATGWLLFAMWGSGLLIPFAAAGLVGIGLGILVPLLFASVMRAVRGPASGQAVGLLSTSLFLGSFVSPLLTAPLHAAFGLAGMMGALCILTLILTAASVAGAGRASDPR